MIIFWSLWETAFFHLNSVLIFLIKIIKLYTSINIHYKTIKTKK